MISFDKLFGRCILEEKDFCQILHHILLPGPDSSKKVIQNRSRITISGSNDLMWSHSVPRSRIRVGSGIFCVWLSHWLSNDHTPLSPKCVRERQIAKYLRTRCYTNAISSKGLCYSIIYYTSLKRQQNFLFDSYLPRIWWFIRNAYVMDV